MMMTSEQVEELLKENERLRQHAVDKNPLCKGCEYWRRAMAKLWAGLWLCIFIVMFDTVRLGLGLSDRESMKQLLFIAWTHPRMMVEIFGIALAPLLLVIARWNWVLWKHDESGRPKQVSAPRITG